MLLSATPAAAGTLTFSNQGIPGGLFNQVLGSDNDKLNLGVSYEAGYSSPNTAGDVQDRIGVTVSTQISDRILFNGRFGVPVGGVSESAVAGDAEVQLLLNEEGTLSMRIFNRQNDVRQYLADQQGYTQGIGLSYEVDFNSFRELLRHLFGTRQEPPPIAPDSTAVRPVDTEVMGSDSLIRFYSKKQKPF